MAECETRREVAVDDQLAIVQRQVMSAAQRDEVRSAMIAAVSASLQMVHVDPIGVSATWHLATMMIAPEHCAPHGRRDILR